MPSAKHLFTGVAPTAPTQYTDASMLAYYHVVVSPDYQQPVQVAATLEALQAGLGDRLDPGSFIDLYGYGVWVAGPVGGGNARIMVERRVGVTTRSVDVLGQQTAITSAKATGPRILTPEVWRPIVTGVIGMVEFHVQAEGGVAWVGTHVDLTQPPNANPDSGGVWPVYPGSTLTVRGNGAFYAYAYSPGVTVNLLKVCRAWGFGS